MYYIILTHDIIIQQKKIFFKYFTLVNTHNNGVKTIKIILKISAVIFSVAIVALLFVFAFYYFATKDVVFDESKLLSPVPTCEIYDLDGAKFEESKKYDYVSLDEISKFTQEAFIAVEDKRFFAHGGIDFKGMVRASLNNLASLSLKEGGSTISQQLVKNAFLSGEKKFSRKLKEIKLATELEKRYSKKEILEIYLNTIYFGKGIYGISNAAKCYLGKNVNELDIGESAMLAGIIKSPAKYNPVDNPVNSERRKDIVLKLMHEQNYIGKSEYDNFKNADITIKFEKNYDKRNNDLTEIKKYCCLKLGFENEEELNGYKIYTSLKRNISDIIPTTEDYGLDCDYTVIIVDNETKAIRGYASSAGDLRRCPASAAKPWLVYAPALEEKIITEATKINDEKTTFGNYSPKNADGKFHGFVSAKEALSKSYNIPSVKLADSMGTDKIIAYAKKMNVGFDNDDLSVSLGNLSGGITLNQLISCYSCFTNYGNFVEYSAVEKIVNPKGKVVFENKKNQNKVFSDSTAFLINDMLKDAVKNGTAKKLSSFPFEICAKTGTNGDKNGNTDAYCVAYTVRHTVAVWLGNANGKAMSNSVTGGNYPAAIIRDIFSALYKTDYPENFTIPESVVRLNIDKTEYEKNQKLLLREKCDKDSLTFYFSKDNSPTEYALKKDSTPIIKDYKINCKNNEISIFITTDKGTGFYIADENENIVYKSNQGGEYKFSATEKEYNLFAIPFLTDENGEEIKGEKIKLPVIKPESGKKKITDTPWWEE